MIRPQDELKAFTNNNISYILSSHRTDYFSTNSPLNVSIAKNILEKLDNNENIDHQTSIIQRFMHEMKDENDVIQEEKCQDLTNRSNALSNISLESINKLENNENVKNIFTNTITSGVLKSKEKINCENNLFEIKEQTISMSEKKNQEDKENDIMIKKYFLNDFRSLKDEVINIQNNLQFSKAYNKKLEEVLLAQVLILNLA